MKVDEKHLGKQTIYGIYNGSKCEIVAECQLSDAVIKFKVDADDAQEYFQESKRRVIQEIFPKLCKEHRELLVAGNSPAEQHQLLGRDMPKTFSGFKRKYKKFGYQWPK